MDRAEERREMKRQQEHYIMLQAAADSQYGIPTRCLCGSRIINEVHGKEEYDTLPGKRFFTCKNYEVNHLCIPFKFFLSLFLFGRFYVVTKDDGLHCRHPWVFAVQEEIERLTKRVKESEEYIFMVGKLSKQIEKLEEQVQELTVKVHILEKLCIDTDVVHPRVGCLQDVTG
ncbi:hypothetical protein Bca101_065845 [Brassica carinata]